MAFTKQIAATAVLPALFLSACSSAYYKTMEGLGIEKRDILVDRVESARDAQDDAGEQFASALDQFRAVVRWTSWQRSVRKQCTRAAG